MNKYKDVYINTYITVKNPNPEPNEDDMMDIDVEARCTYLPGAPGTYWDPPESPEIYLEEVETLDGRKVDLNTLSKEEVARIEDAALQEVTDGYFDY